MKIDRNRVVGGEEMESFHLLAYLLSSAVRVELLREPQKHCCDNMRLPP